MREKHPRSQHIIRFQDCDAFGHLNNANFLHYFINAREDHLRSSYGLDLYAHARETGNNWFVARHEIAYLHPAQLGETVTIQTGLLAFSENAVTVESLMFDEAGTRLKALLWTDYRYVDLQRGRPASHDDELMALLAEVALDPDTIPPTLDVRLADLKQQQRARRTGATA